MTADAQQPGWIDSHCHTWDLARGPQDWTSGIATLSRSFPADELTAVLDHNRVPSCVLVQSTPSVPASQDLLALSAIGPRFAGVVGWVDLTSTNRGAHLDALQQQPGNLVGIRVDLTPHTSDVFHSAELHRGLRELGHRDLTFDLQITDAQLDACTVVVDSAPDTRFVLDHAGNPAIDDHGTWSHWTSAINALARRPNVAVKVSGLVTQSRRANLRPVIQPYVDHLVQVFTPSRMMMGSDWPVCLLAATYEEVITLTQAWISGLTPHEQDLIGRLVAKEWYRL